MSNNDKHDNSYSPVEDALDKLFASDLDGLLDEPEKPKKVTSSDRLERGFLEIIDFYESNGREPSSNTYDIAERRLGARLDGIRVNQDKVEALKSLDTVGLLAEPETPDSIDDLLESDDLGLLEDTSGVFDVSSLPQQRKKPIAGVEKALRKKCTDFETFEPLFKRMHAQLASGEYVQQDFENVNTIEVGRFFVLNGVMLYIAEMGEDDPRITGGRVYNRQRLRIIFENGTESSMWRQSLGIRLHEKDGRSIKESLTNGVLADERPSGWIYILRSLSEDPQITSIPNLYKIGFSRGSVEKRIAGAERQATYLMAPVEIVATYRTVDIKTSALEHLIHRVFASARIDAKVAGVDGFHHQASEWFSVPLDVINDAINLIGSGGIVNYVYDDKSQSLKPTEW